MLRFAILSNRNLDCIAEELILTFNGLGFAGIVIAVTAVGDWTTVTLQETDYTEINFDIVTSLLVQLVDSLGTNRFCFVKDNVNVNLKLRVLYNHELDSKPERVTKVETLQARSRKKTDWQYSVYKMRNNVWFGLFGIFDFFGYVYTRSLHYSNPILPDYNDNHSPYTEYKAGEEWIPMIQYRWFDAVGSRTRDLQTRRRIL